MVPIEFPQQTTIIAKNQPEYMPLPSHLTEDGEVITCWHMSIKERFQVLFFGVIWLRIKTFNKPLQPVCLETENPWKSK